MGKAAERRKERRQKYFSELAVSRPEKFQEEWEKRMDSWVHEIWKRAGRLVDEKGKPIPPAFEVVEHAMRLLKECGVKKAVLKNCTSVEMLIYECCKVLSHHIDIRIYHLNAAYKKK